MGGLPAQAAPAIVIAPIIADGLFHIGVGTCASSPPAENSATLAPDWSSARWISIAHCAARRAPAPSEPRRSAPWLPAQVSAPQTKERGSGGVIARGAAAAKAHAPLLPDRLPRASVAAPAEAYTQLKAELSEIAALGGIEGLLSWDQAAMLPPGAQELRAKQMAALRPAPPGTRKAILATNIAETSLTIDGVVYVVDAGLAKTRAFHAAKGIDSLLALPISQATSHDVCPVSHSVSA